VLLIKKFWLSCTVKIPTVYSLQRTARGLMDAFKAGFSYTYVLLGFLQKTYVIPIIASWPIGLDQDEKNNPL